MVQDISQAVQFAQSYTFQCFVHCNAHEPLSCQCQHCTARKYTHTEEHQFYPCKVVPYPVLDVVHCAICIHGGGEEGIMMTSVAKHTHAEEERWELL